LGKRLNLKLSISDLHCVSLAERSEVDSLEDAELSACMTTGDGAFKGATLLGEGAPLGEAASTDDFTFDARSLDDSLLFEERKEPSLLELLSDDLKIGDTESARKKLPLVKTIKINKKQCLTFMIEMQWRPLRQRTATQHANAGQFFKK
jgi:hypothetical protein